MPRMVEELYHRKWLARRVRTRSVLQYGVIREADIHDSVDVFIHESVDEKWLNKFVENEVLPKL